MNTDERTIRDLIGYMETSQSDEEFLGLARMVLARW